MRWEDLAGLVDLNTLLSTLGWAVLGLLTVAEKLAPKEKKPWSALARALGHEMTRDMRERMDGVDKRLSQLSDKLDDVKAFGEETRAIAARVRILRFGDELAAKQRHSKDSFDQALMDINAYDAYCEEHPHFRNHITRTTSDYIMAQYKERLEKHDFTY
nr:MAG TPA: hypothetical protein [Caudoviricetes sp.]